MQAEKRRKTKGLATADLGESTRENRWCERYGYFIDIEACKSRALTRPYCGRCLCRWRQTSFPFLSAN